MQPHSTGAFFGPLLYPMNHANRLVNETSPYLLQHAHNPVDWYPWGNEALQRAVDEAKPILVSIGYAACHWCHVMERESFEDLQTAELMNAHFVCIKIDREERPDLDHFFMDALQAISGQGGWPLNMFLTSEARPFYGGTYFPPRAAHNRMAWKDLLVQVHKAFHEKQTEIQEQAAQLVQYLRDANQQLVPPTLNTDFGQSDVTWLDQADTVFQHLIKSADTTEGGFGAAPKFLQTSAIQYLLRYHLFYDQPKAMDQALLTIRKMVHGGIYDQVGGGFSRYSTDNAWLAPHFEKMTYDNALMLLVMAEAYQMTLDAAYKRVAIQTVGFMVREMQSTEGGYFSALDADSEGVEGKFYTWTEGDFQQAMGNEAGRFASFFDVTQQGNWEQVNILRMKKPLEEWAQEQGIPIDEAVLQTTLAKEKLLHARQNRVRPGTDDKIILGWNALFNQALLKGSVAFGQPQWLDLATAQMEFLLRCFEDPTTGAWLHTYKNGFARYPAFLDDLAYLVQALVFLYEPTGNLVYLKKAESLMERILLEFSDEEQVFFYFTASFQVDVPVRKKEIYDGAMPSSNAVMAWNLHRMGLLLGRADWLQRAQDMLGVLREMVVKYPTSFGVWANLLLETAKGTEEILVLGNGAAEALKDLLSHPIPNHIAMAAEQAHGGYPLMVGRKPEKDGLLYYVCRNYSCSLPVRSKEAVLAAILTKS